MAKQPPPRSLSEIINRSQLAEALDDARAYSERFIAWPDDHASAIIALWVGHTYAMDQLDSTPRLAFMSAQKESGKSRALEILHHLSNDAVKTTSVSSAALVWGLVDHPSMTLLVDEIDTVYGEQAKGDETLRAIIDSGYRADGVVSRATPDPERKGHFTMTNLPCFSPIALAGLETLPDTIEGRTIVIQMQRRKATQKVEPFRFRLNGPEGKTIAKKLAVAMEKIKLSEHPETLLPEGVEDRTADCWEPLFAVAHAAGGHWPRLVKAACKFYTETPADEAPILAANLQILADLRDIYYSYASPRVSTKAVLFALHEITDSPHGDVVWSSLDRWGLRLTEQQLAKRLRPYGIRPKKIRFGQETLSGYLLDQLHDAWARYLPPLEQLEQLEQPRSDVPPVLPVLAPGGYRGQGDA